LHQLSQARAAVRAVFRRRRSVAVLAVGAAASIASAAGAYVCHPDPAGTRVLALPGQVVAYAAKGSEVEIALREGRCTRMLVWRPLLSRVRAVQGRRCAAGGPRTRPGVRRATDGATAAIVEYDGRVSIRVHGALVRRVIPHNATPHELVALERSRLLVLVPAVDTDSPEVLSVYSVATGKLVRRWPIPFHATTLDVSRGTAVLGAGRGGGLYALRLHDGRIAFVAANRRDDRPQFAGPGIVYQSKSSARGGVVLKYVPVAAVRADLVAAGRSRTLDGPLRAFAMDGPRVATAVVDPRSGCDRITFWNVPWNYVAAVTEPDEHDATCPRHGARPRVTALALGGIRATWILSRGRDRKLVTSTSKACIENVVPTRGFVLAVSADGPMTSYGTTRALGRLAEDWSGLLDADDASVRAVAADAGRVAALHRDGTIAVWADGAVAPVAREPAARAIALRADRLLVLTERSLLVFDVDTGTQTAVWPLPRGTSASVDAQYGIAVVAAGRRVFAIDLATGRTAVVAAAPGRVHAQIEAPGIAYGYNVAGHGKLAFVPFARVELAVR
jgi:hypothetical protein